MRSRVVAAFAILMITGLLAGQADGSEFMGDACWALTPQGMTVTALLKMGLFRTSEADQGFIMSGTLTFGSGVVPYNGSMEEIDGRFRGNLLNAGFSQGMIFTQHASFDLDSSWNGTYKGVSHFYNTGNNLEGPTIDQGTMVQVACP